MKARDLFIACASIAATVISSASFAWAAVSCDDAGEAGDPPVFCNRYSDGAQLGFGNLNASGLPTVTRIGDGRDLTIYGYDDDGVPIPSCFAQTLVGVTDVTVHADIFACPEPVFSFSIVGKDIFTP